MAFSVIDNKVVNFLKEAKIELAKVVWPTRQELIRHTLIVIGMSLVTAFFLGVVDYFLNIGLESIV